MSEDTIGSFCTKEENTKELTCACVKCESLENQNKKL